jgi:hypothetical protein
MADIILLDAQAIQAKNDNLAKMADALAVVTANDLPAAQDLLKGAQRWEKFIEDQRSAAKAPYLDKGREIDEMAKSLAAPVALAKEVIKGKIVRYQQEVERKELARRNEVNSCIAAIQAARDEAAVDAALSALPFDDAGAALAATQRKNALAVEKEQAAERERLAKESKRLADIAKKQGEEAAALAQEKQRQAQEARQAEQAKLDAQRKAEEDKQAQDAKEARRRAEALSTVTSAKGVRKERLFEVVDASKLPRRFLMADEKAIRAAVKAEDGVKWEEMGVRVWEETTVR